MSINLSRYNENWKISLEEKWRVPDEKSYNYVTNLLMTNGLRFSIGYPAKPYGEVRDIVIRESKIYKGVDKAKQLIDVLITLKEKFGVVFD